MKKLLAALMCFGLLVLTSGLAFGQAEAGTIAGTVRDTSGAVISGATITVKNVATGLQRATQSGTVGQYNIPGLTPGHYQVSITDSGFSPYKLDTEVTVGGTVTVDAQLAVGNQSTTVEVMAGAAQVNTQTQELS